VNDLHTVTVSVRGLGPVRVTTPAPRPVWVELAQRDEGAPATQLPQWLDCLITATGGSDASRLCETADGRRIVVPAVSVRALGRDLTTRAWPPGWGYGGALTDDGELRPDDARLALSGLGRPPVLWSALVPPPWRSPVYEQVAPAGVRRTRHHVHVVDLTGGPAAVWSRLKHASRTAIRKAERSGLEITAGTSPAELNAFAELYHRSQRRWAAQRGQPAPLARMLNRHRDRARQVAAVACAMPEACTVWVARMEGRPVAANIVLLHGRQAMGWLSAMDDDLARRTQGTYLLHWRTFVEAWERGATCFDLGESEPGSAVALHKSRLGAVPREYSSYTLDPVRVHALGDVVRRTGINLLARRACRSTAPQPPASARPGAGPEAG
jgi:CelD/BcsL family acetyltransferase involved in cellulose biosynthesis